MSRNSYDVIVIGTGTHGSSDVHEMARNGIKVLGIDQHDPRDHVNSLGAYKGDSRLNRFANAEGPTVTQGVIENTHLWAQYQDEANDYAGTTLKLFQKTGILIMQHNRGQLVHGTKDFLGDTLAMAGQFNIEHEYIADQKVFDQRFPLFTSTSDTEAYFETESGVLFPRACIEAQLSLGERYGATLKYNSKVTSVTSDANSVTVKTDDGETYTANRAVLSTGPWVNELLPENLKNLFITLPENLLFYEMPNWRSYSDLNEFSAFLIATSEGYIYGTPHFATADQQKIMPYFKIAREQWVRREPIDKIWDMPVPAAEISIMTGMLKKLFQYPQGGEPRFVKAVRCAYSKATPDTDKVPTLDFVDEHQRILLKNLCNGAGFKQTLWGAKGTRIAVTTGKTPDHWSQYSIQRLVDPCAFSSLLPAPESVKLSLPNYAPIGPGIWERTAHPISQSSRAAPKLT